MSQSSWIDVGALGEAFARDALTLQPALPPQDYEFTMQYPGLGAEHYQLEPDRIVVRADGGGYELHRLRLTALRPEFTLIDGLLAGDPRHSVSLILDQRRGRILRIGATLPGRDEAALPLYRRAKTRNSLSPVTWDFAAGHSGNGKLIALSADLVGMHNRYHYSPHEIYDHIYLSPAFFTWHCIKGAEQGLCDTDATACFKLDDGLYLFAWREKIIPTLGVILIDLHQARTDGKIFGYKDDGCDSAVNFPIGARIERIASLREAENGS